MIDKYLNKITCGDCYELIKELPDKSVDCIYTDVPYLLPNTKNTSGGFMADRVNRVGKKELEDIKDGIDFEILKHFVRVCKTLNIYIYGATSFLLKIFCNSLLKNAIAKNMKLWYGVKAILFQ